jgi:hypothetical protein
MTAPTTNITASLADQLDWHWHASLRPRLDGLTDDEYLWEPVPGCWTVRHDGTVDFAYPTPEPPPFVRDDCIAVGAHHRGRVGSTKPFTLRWPTRQL